MDAVEEAVFQLKLYGAVPPTGVTVADPVDPPKHRTDVAFTDRVSDPVGWVISMVDVFTQLFPSVTSSEYVPANSPWSVLVEPATGDQL